MATAMRWFGCYFQPRWLPLCSGAAVRMGRGHDVGLFCCPFCNSHAFLCLAQTYTDTRGVSPGVGAGTLSPNPADVSMRPCAVLPHGSLEGRPSRSLTRCIEILGPHALKKKACECAPGTHTRCVSQELETNKCLVPTDWELACEMAFC